MSDELNKIKEILEQIRSVEHPEVSQSVIEEILSAQVENLDDSTKSQKAVKTIVDNTIKSLA